MTLPEPPVNVRMVLEDGTEIPVDTVYVGEQDGIHEWHVLNGPPPGQVMEVRIDKLPPATMVSFEG